jgi:hypothetical protein
MKRRTFIKNTGAAAILGTGLVGQACTTTNGGMLGNTQIQHGVIFSLIHEKGSPAAKKFLEDGKRLLTSIPVVINDI